MSLGVTILVVDDEKNAREGLRQFLNGLDYDVHTAGSGKEALDLVKKERPEVILADLKIPEINRLNPLH